MIDHIRKTKEVHFIKQNTISILFEPKQQRTNNCNTFRSVPYIIFVFYWLPVPRGCWICRPSWVSVFFVSASALKNCLFQLHLLLCESQRVFVAVCSCVCVLLCMYVCTPLLVRQSLFVLSESHKLCHTAAPWPILHGTEKENTKREWERALVFLCRVLSELIHQAWEWTGNPS